MENARKEPSAGRSNFFAWSVVITASVVLVLSNYRAQQMFNIVYRGAVIASWVSFSSALFFSPRMRQLVFQKGSLTLIAACTVLVVFMAAGWGDRAWLYAYVSLKTLPLFYAGILSGQRKAYQYTLLVSLIVSMSAVSLMDILQFRNIGGAGLSREMMASVVAQTTSSSADFGSAESQIQHMIYHFPALSLTTIFALGLWLENRTTARHLLVGPVLLIGVMVVTSTWTASVLMLFAGIILFTVMVTFRGKLSVRARALIAVGTLAAVVFMGFYIVEQANTSRHDSGVMAGRLTSLTTLLSSSEQISDHLDMITGGRVARFEMSLNSFFKDPLFGVGNNTYDPDVGGHSFWVDMLAQYGLCGAGLIFYWLWIVFRNSVSLILKPQSDVIDCACFTVIVVYYFSLVGNPYFFVTMPISIFFVTAGMVVERSRTLGGWQEQGRDFLARGILLRQRVRSWRRES